MNGFQRFGRAGTVILVILHGDVVGGTHFQPVKQLVQGGLVGIIVLPYLPGAEHFHDHGEILLIFRRFVPQVKYQRHEEHTGRRIPERIVGLAPFRGGGFEQVRHHLLHIVVGFQIGKGIVAVAFLHVQKVHHLDLIAHPFQQAAAVTQQLALAVQNKEGRIALADVHFGIEAAFSRPAASHHQGVEVAAVFSAIQPHADVLGENAVFDRVLVPVFLIHGPRIAPFGGAVFFAPAVIAPGRKINANAQPIGGNKNEDSFYTVLTPHNFEWIVHCRRQGVYDLRKSPGNGRRNQQGEPDHRDQPQGIEPGAARLVIWLHPGASLSCLFGLGRQWF